MFIAEEDVELYRLNAAIQRRRKAAVQMAVAKATAARQKEKKQEKAVRRKKLETRRLIVQEIKVLVGTTVVWLGMKAGLVAAVWAIPVLSYFQAVIFFRLGKYFGKYFPRWFRLWQ